ncbi:hypothetical protein GQ44DRAFT_712406 [Phaeosphaeriaceae sp. PMI808]|nr:hypothetical protein GQ44DRAFT_712406 [Phaeosphaeriaceae sp. PMI808]
MLVLNYFSATFLHLACAHQCHPYGRDVRAWSLDCQRFGCRNLLLPPARRNIIFKPSLSARIRPRDQLWVHISVFLKRGMRKNLRKCLKAIAKGAYLGIPHSW